MITFCVGCIIKRQYYYFLLFDVRIERNVHIEKFDIKPKMYETAKLKQTHSSW